MAWFKKLKKNEKGFTLTEMLIVVAILAVLLGIAGIAIYNIYRTTKQNEMDSKAEIIYSAAQNRLLELKSAGMTDEYSPENEDGSKNEDVHAIPAGVMATLLGISADSEDCEGFVYVTTKDVDGSGDYTIRTILPEGTIESEIFEQNYVIEYSYKTGSVFAVFYAEDAESLSGYNPEDSKFISTYRNHDSRKKAGAKIGYYDGGVTKVEATTKLTPLVSIENGEKLTATITCAKWGNMSLSFEITVSDSKGNKKVLSKTDYKQTTGVNSDTCEVVLDSLKDGERFKEKFPDLTPGDDITVSVTVECSDSLVDQGTASETANSLFAEVEDDTAYINCVRHLQNLDEYYCADKEGNTTFTKAIQKSDIDFLDTDSEDDFYDTYGTTVAFKPIKNLNLVSYDGATVEEESTGEDSQESASGETSGTITVYTSINNLSISADSADPAGLFSKFGSASGAYSISNVSLKSLKIDGGDAVTGGLVGKVSGETKISNCKVYIGNDNDEREILIDEGNGSGADFDAYKENGGIYLESSGIVGGLVGESDATLSVESSFASTVISAGKSESSYAGGLVGKANGTLSVETSYSDCYLFGANTAGIVAAGSDSGEADDISITNSYVAGFSYGTKSQSGFTALDVSKIQNAYSAMYFETGDSDSEVYTTAGKGSAVFDKDDAEVDATQENLQNTDTSVFYLAASNAEQTNHDATKSLSYDELSDRRSMISYFGTDENGQSAFSATTSGYTTPYNLKSGMALDAYAFPRLAELNHYGDWQTEFTEGSLCYYEVYADESGVGFYGGVNALKDKVVKGDGYGILFEGKPKDGVAITVEYETEAGKGDNGTNKKAETITVLEDTDTLSATYKNKTYTIVKIDTDIVDSGYESSSFYQTISIKMDGESDKNYVYNPHFAYAFMTGDNTDAAVSDSTIRVRSARQLYDMSMYYETYAGKTKNCTFSQETDIDYDSYDWGGYSTADPEVESQGSIGTESVPFAAKYNGGCNYIENLSFEDDQYIGLFGYVGDKGTLSNIVLYNAYEEDDDGSVTYTLKHANGGISGYSTYVYAGALAAYNRGTIQNCSAASYTAKLNVSRAHLYVGGLVGRNAGTIKTSFGELAYLRLSSTYATVRAGGLVGANSSSIQGSYAYGFLKAVEARDDVTSESSYKVILAGFAAENTGSIKNSYCATALSASGKSSAYAFAPDANAGAKGSGSASKCFYLFGGTYNYLGSLRSYLNESGAGTAKNYEELENVSISSKFETTSDTPLNVINDEKHDEYKFGFKTSIDNAKGRAVHYGNWPISANVGTIGVFYWEYESGGSNSGYHFHALGIDSETKTQTLDYSTLCTQHDDGGTITSYGYGYFYQDEISGLEFSLNNFNGNEIPADARTSSGGNVSDVLEAQMEGYKFVAWQSLPVSVKDTNTQKQYLLISGNDSEGTLTLSLDSNSGDESVGGSGSETTNTYSFKITPFFGDSFAYADSGSFTLGDSNHAYKIRSIDQLQHINWNWEKRNSTSIIESKNASYNGNYTYLKYGTSNSKTSDFATINYYFEQQHDVELASTQEFIPIGSFYDDVNGDNGRSDISMAAFAGSYNGNSYQIKNIYIESTGHAIGLFGITVGADLKNIIMYADSDHSGIYLVGGDDWYGMGGLVGFATQGGNGNASIKNCSVSGYKIQVTSDRKAGTGWGGGSIGGLIGVSNMKIQRCSSVNDIDVTINYVHEYGNVRIGGLVGVCRNAIEYCYTGGSIQCRRGNNYTSNTGLPYSNMYVGGILGGVVMKPQGMEFIGGSTGPVSVSNCYTYMKLPKKSDSTNVRASNSIASLGEMQFTATFKPYSVGETTVNCNITIKDCYALSSAVSLTDDYEKYSRNHNVNWTDWQMNDSDSNNKFSAKLTNTGNHCPYLTYDEMSDNYKLLAYLGGDANSTDGTKYSKVTTEEDNLDVTGKYSFPGSNTSLQGLNYPFPTILTQTSLVTGDTVNVHYGEWPNGDIYWEKSSHEVSLLTLADNGYIYNMNLYVNGYDETDSTKSLSFTLTDESGNASTIAGIDASSCTYNSSTGFVTVPVKLSGSGTVYLTASYGSATSEKAVLIVNTDLIVSASPAEITLEDKQTTTGSVGTEYTVTMSAKASSEDSATEYATVSGMTWSFESYDSSIADVVSDGSGTKIDSAGKITIKSLAVGDTTIKATAKYTKDNITYTGSATITVEVVRPLQIGLIRVPEDNNTVSYAYNLADYKLSASTDNGTTSFNMALNCPAAADTTTGVIAGKDVAFTNGTGMAAGDNSETFTISREPTTSSGTDTLLPGTYLFLTGTDADGKGNSTLDANNVSLVSVTSGSNSNELTGNYMLSLEKGYELGDYTYYEIIVKENESSSTPNPSSVNVTIQVVLGSQTYQFTMTNVDVYTGSSGSGNTNSASLFEDTNTESQAGNEENVTGENGTVSGESGTGENGTVSGESGTGEKDTVSGENITDENSTGDGESET